MVNPGWHGRRGTGWGVNLMVCDARSSKSVRGPIRDMGGAIEDMACGVVGRGKPWPFQVEDCCGDNTSGIFNRVFGYGVNLGYHRPYLQGRWVVLYHRPCGVALEGHVHHHWLENGGLHQVTWCYSWVERLVMNWYSHLGRHTPPEECGHT